MKDLSLRICAVFLLSMAALAAGAQTDLLTQHGDMARTGWDQSETELKVANVSANSFGLLATRAVDGQIYSQPLVVSGVAIAGKARNVVYVTTVKNKLYAFDGDDATIPAYWSVDLTQPGRRLPVSDDIHSPCGTYNDFNTGGSGSGIFGIVGTPVIDKNAGILYVVSRDVDAAAVDQQPGYPADGFYQYLHAIDITTGKERAGSPVAINATGVGKANGNNNGILTFDTRRQNQRGGLLLMHGVVYIPFAAHCDWNNYNGWILAYDAATLAQKAAYVASPNDGGGGIWMSGGGVAADPAANNGNGSLYFSSGNSGRTDPGADDPNTRPDILENRGEGIVKLNPDATGAALTKLAIADYFTPFNYSVLNQNDLDFGTQVMLIPNSNLLVAGCKDYNLYTFDKTNLGGYDPNANHNLQKIFTSTGAGMHTAFAYFGGSKHQYFYQFSENANLKAFAVTPGALTVPAVAGVGNGPVGQAGTMMSTSSNGPDETTGILWISHAVNCDANQSSCPGILRAVNAADPTSEIWNSAAKGADAVGTFAKNACPTIANGKVYLATFSNRLDIYGLLASNTQCADNVAIGKTATDNTGNAANAGLAIDGNNGTAWTGSGTPADYLDIDLGKVYDICRLTIDWVDAAGVGQDFRLQTALNANGPWTTVENITGNSALANAYSGKFNGRYVRMQGVTPAGVYHIAELGVFGVAAPTCPAPTGLTVGGLTTDAAVISWNAAAGAQSYQLRYKTGIVSSYVTREVTAGVMQNLTALTCGLDYTVDVRTVCSATATSSYATVPLSTRVCTDPCTLLTRYNHADLGDIGIAGSSCSVGYAGPPQKTVFTVRGAGTGIGGTADQFQFAETDLAGDQTYTGRLTVQDNLGNNQAGVMMRDSLSNTSRFVFVGVTAGAGIQFIYRTVPGGPVTVKLSTVPAALPCYFQIVKKGTLYTANISPDGITWTTVGSADPGFGLTGSVKQGFAVSSGDNGRLSTAQFELYDELPTPGASLNFTATNNDNRSVILKWTTPAESGNAYFLVEHSLDSINYDSTVRVSSLGNSSTPQSYMATDPHPADGLNYYRLKQFDSAGRLTLYPAVSVELSIEAIPAVYPNPVADVIHIMSGKQPVLFARLFDLTGKEIRRYDNTGADAHLILNVSNLAVGVYVLKMTTAEKVYQQKIIKR